jgi:uncharacterized membrane protein YhaH (DUF805 family)
MSIARLLFGTNGRINRAQYWLALAIQLSVWAIVILMVVNSGHVPYISIAVLVIAGALFLAVVASAFAVATKRLQDRGKSKSWVTPFVLVPALLLIGSRKVIDPQTAAVIVSAACAILVWAIVELGVLRGTSGPNQYGPDPLEKARS